MKVLFIYTVFILIELVYTAVVSKAMNDEMDIILSRHIKNIIEDYSTNKSNIDLWASSIKPEGLWSDVDMTSGCEARTALWPALDHLMRARSMATAYATDYTDTTLLSKIMLALDYWFEHDYQTPGCLDSGGSRRCPCGTPGLWNKNWFDQSIAVPRLIGDLCLLLEPDLSPSQHKQCIQIQSRSFDTIDKGLHGGKHFTGANLADLAAVGISLNLLRRQSLTDPIRHLYESLEIRKTTLGDGIHSDGSFSQHGGILYSGNYGNVYLNDLVSVLAETKGTSLEPDEAARLSFWRLLEGMEWMMVADVVRERILWQYSTIGRMVSFRFEDAQASGGVMINTKRMRESAVGWLYQPEIEAILDRLEAPLNESANQGGLVGTRYFYNADYMVHRAPTYIVTMKMYSNRLINSECTNIQNQYGFHLSDGAIYNYLTGDEYVDVFGSWNWELVPGTTVDYQGTPLNCKSTKQKGKKSFVGGVTDENMGVVVFDYLNPMTGNLAYQKTVFFFPKAYAVQVGSVRSRNQTAPLVTVLDQKHRKGDIYMNGGLKNTNSSYLAPSYNLWHDRIGYFFLSEETIKVESEFVKTNWSDIGISSGTDVHQLWTATIQHEGPKDLLSQYVVIPDIDAEEFIRNANDYNVPISLDFVNETAKVHAAFSALDRTIGIAYWKPGKYISPWNNIQFESDQACVLLFREIRTDVYRLTAADPTGLLRSVNLVVTQNGVSQSAHVVFLAGVDAGKGVSVTLAF